ncbi:MAG: photosystem I reaction center subunit IV [Gammaproteobacteria bacterium]|uniref:BNR repeat protein n=2 Tax=Marinobacter nitratireducens TaxID=1137280 RepID=A0A072N5U8_9GAMM|nr:BNR repeat protein [Marinobacter nitratireducens]TNE78100.1 MAG: photosystem I reaction center subunit IV [Gammaproteobacteria bacterium]
MCKTLGAACLGLSMACASPIAFALEDVIDKPARPTELAPESLLNDVVRAGDRIVAVGERGHIIYSDDEGQSWTQAQVPVSVTLTGIDFSSDAKGWAVGHSGVVLHSEDAGANWEIQLTGIRAAELAIASQEDAIADMEARVEAAPEDEKGDLEWALDDLYFSLENMQADLDIGPVNPFLDVWFGDNDNGFVVGAYGMLFHTKDGGETWQDWAPKLENPQKFHLNSVTRVAGGAMVIVGEAGQIHVSVDGGDTWERRESPYPGSLFGVIGTGRVNEILAFGLRGTLMFSSDLGKSWSMVNTGSTATLNDGMAEDDRVVLVGNGGTVLTSGNGGDTFRDYVRADRQGLMSVVPADGTDLLMVGESGVTITDAQGKNLQ